MKFMLMIHEDETVLAAQAPDVRNAVIDKHREFARGLGPRFVYGAGLEDTPAAMTVRFRGGRKSRVKGAANNASEQFGGFYVVDVPDMAAALALAETIPLTADGSVEVRPLIGD